MSPYASEGFNNPTKETSTIDIAENSANDHESQRTSTSEEQQGPSVRVLGAVEKFWIFEFFGFILALGSLLAVIAFLRVYDGRESPEWKLPVGAGTYRKTFVLNINAIISIFTTTFTSGLLIPVAASMSQLKWVWFQQGRPLSHYQAFESAARGPLGSVFLLWTLRGRRLACVGAIIVVAALGVGFSIQSLVIYPLRPVATDHSSIGRTNVYYGTDDGLPYQMSADMLGATLRGIFQSSDPSEMKYNCPSGNCTWPEGFTTLGICNQCFNVTDSLQKSCSTADIEYVSPTGDGSTNSTASVPYCNYTLPNGLRLDGIDSGMSTGILNSGNWNNSVHFSDNNNTIGVLSSIQSKWTSSPSEWQDLDSGMIYATAPYEVKATECGLSYCVQKFNTSVLRGALTEQLIDTYVDSFIDAERVAAIVFHPPPSWTNASENDSANIYVAGAVQGFRQFFSKEFSGQKNSTVYSVTSSDSDFAVISADWEFSNFTDLFTSIAKSMTNSMRSSPYAELYAEPGMIWSAIGVSNQERPHVQVRWAWIALPSTLLGLSIILLLGTIWTTSKEKTILWKGNSLAAFAHPLAGDMRDKISTITGPREMQQEAERLQVQWLKTDRGYRLVPPKQD
ncbi:uncharacterized protein A1O9_09624 [Exophiala aquamarina CBS 119918]|uniref:Uncharacterized protein n=1 Tax=Exophiala aquamarina CBS 119918 TaxID=1182545 RepID=A0A072P422_9EURO|nr:uncharacterized protein A1O9_09624 [Exophiala aquamarina CBS 119918]KEF54457.1 hypothetical protein A1O9_09624 [Exophiala aquamarina CBS 119918]